MGRPDGDQYIMIDRIRPFAGFDYIQAGNPTIDVNPGQEGVTWVNMTTGELFVCIDATVDTNIWIGQFGTAILYRPSDGMTFCSGDIVSNLVTDISGNDYHMVADGSIPSTKVGLTTMIGPFSTGSQCPRRTTNAADILVNSALTVSYWTNCGGNGVIISKGGDGESVSTNLLNIRDNYGFIESGGGANHSYSTTTSIVYPDWTHVVITLIGGHWCTFINGVVVWEFDAVTPDTTTTNIAIGGEAEPGVPAGSFANASIVGLFRFYNRELTITEIQELYNEGKTLLVLG